GAAVRLFSQALQQRAERVERLFEDLRRRHRQPQVWLAGLLVATDQRKTSGFRPVADFELGKNRMFAQGLQLEVLLPAALPPQPDLPGLQRHILGLVQPRKLRPPRSFFRLASLLGSPLSRSLQLRALRHRCHVSISTTGPVGKSVTPSPGLYTRE